jgi:glutamate-1-semialdehyde 2,1-aminomutase
MKITNSSNLFEQSLKYTPLGTQTLSKAPNRYVEGVYPKMLMKGIGSLVLDYDNNWFIDYIAALGPISVGHSNEYINDAIRAQLEDGVLFSMPNELEAAVAEYLTEFVPSTEMWKFTKTGSDANSMAIKAARAATGREKVMVCGYHGWHDWYSVINDKKAGIPLVHAEYITKAKYNDLESFQPLLSGEYAALILEPMVWDYPLPGFLQKLRDYCDVSGTVLIFDEVVTGGRFEGFVAQNYFKVTPDLTVLSKGIANGLPLAAVGGKQSIMKQFERDDFFASTTFGGELLSLAACLATLDVLEDNLPTMVERGRMLQDGFNKVFDGKATCVGYPTRTQFNFPTVALKALFWQECIKRNVLFGYSNFIMASHTEADIIKTIAVIQEAAKVLNKHWSNPAAALEGSLPVEVLRLR